jgi:hypothetical protein
MDEVTSRKLYIALEPEVAGLYCSSQAKTKFLAASMANLQRELVDGVEYLVMDCGGK